MLNQKRWNYLYMKLKIRIYRSVSSRLFYVCKFYMNKKRPLYIDADLYYKNFRNAEIKMRPFSQPA